MKTPSHKFRLENDQALDTLRHTKKRGLKQASPSTCRGFFQILCDACVTKGDGPTPPSTRDDLARNRGTLLARNDKQPLPTSYTRTIRWLYAPIVPPLSYQTGGVQ